MDHRKFIPIGLNLLEFDFIFTLALAYPLSPPKSLPKRGWGLHHWSQAGSLSRIPGLCAVLSGQRAKVTPASDGILYADARFARWDELVVQFGQQIVRFTYARWLAKKRRIYLANYWRCYRGRYYIHGGWDSVEKKQKWATQFVFSVSQNKNRMATYRKFVLYMGKKRK
jgi:hypothetical protein